MSRGHRPQAGDPAKETDWPAPDKAPERQRLRFELELMASQDAGAALDPLIRAADGARLQARAQPVSDRPGSIETGLEIVRDLSGSPNTR